MVGTSKRIACIAGADGFIPTVVAALALFAVSLAASLAGAKELHAPRTRSIVQVSMQQMDRIWRIDPRLLLLSRSDSTTEYQTGAEED